MSRIGRRDLPRERPSSPWKRTRPAAPNLRSPEQTGCMYKNEHTAMLDGDLYGKPRPVSDSDDTDTVRGGDQLIENNIFQHIASPMLNEGSQGTVHAYNYAIDDYYTSGGS